MQTASFIFLSIFLKKRKDNPHKQHFLVFCNDVSADSSKFTIGGCQEFTWHPCSFFFHAADQLLVGWRAGISPARRRVTLSGAHSHLQRQEACTAASLLTTLQFTSNQNVAPPASHPPPPTSTNHSGFPRAQILKGRRVLLLIQLEYVTSIYQYALNLCCSLHDEH